VRGAFDFNYSFISANSVIAVLKVKVMGNVGTILKEDIADRAINNVVDG
jgi:hypothetical protein